MKINLIAAMTNERVIGLDNRLPWHIHNDLKNFKDLTAENVVIMGRKTYEFLPQTYRPLPKRVNVVVSNSMNDHHEDYNSILVVSTLDEAVARSKILDKDIFIIGGAKMYEAALPIVDQMYISIVKGNYHGNVYFPKFDESQWCVETL